MNLNRIILKIVIILLIVIMVIYFSEEINNNICTKEKYSANQELNNHNLISNFVKIHEPEKLYNNNIFTNSKYRYKFTYSNDMEVWPAGHKGDRDGKSLRVTWFEFNPPTPYLDIYISPSRTSSERKILNVNSTHFFTRKKEIIINRKKTTLYELVNIPSNIVFRTYMYINGVEFIYRPHNGPWDFDYLKIISTFEIERRSKVCVRVYKLLTHFKRWKDKLYYAFLE